MKRNSVLWLLSFFMVLTLVSGSGSDSAAPSVSLQTTCAITSMNIALKNGLAVYAASNGGNRKLVAAEAAPRVWADGTPEGVASANDYAYAALLTTREFARAVIQRFYGRSPAYTYFNGCSNGGRNAYIAADHWPEEYDGIVSGCMGMDLTGQTVGWLNLGAHSDTPAMTNASQCQAVTAALPLQRVMILTASPTA